MNASLVRDAFEREETAYGVSDLIVATLNAERPLVAAPVVEKLFECRKDVLATPCTALWSLK